MSSRYCAAHRHLENRDLEMLKLVSERFRLDLQLFWQRGSLYLVVTAALFSVYASTGTGAAHWALAAFGLTVSAFWFAVSRASAYWIDRWTDELMRADRAVNPMPPSPRCTKRPCEDRGSCRRPSRNGFRS